MCIRPLALHSALSVIKRLIIASAAPGAPLSDHSLPCKVHSPLSRKNETAKTRRKLGGRKTVGSGRPWLSCRQPKSLREASARSLSALALAGALGLWRSKFLAFVSSVQVSARSRCIGALDIQIPGFHAVSPSPCASAQAGASGLLAVQVEVHKE